MAEDKIYTLLIDIQKQLGENTKQTGSVASDLKVYVAEQKAVNSKLNGFYEAHNKLIESIPEERRKEIFGAVNKLEHAINDKLKPLLDDLAERQDTKKKLKTGGSALQVVGLETQVG